MSLFAAEYRQKQFTLFEKMLYIEKPDNQRSSGFSQN